MENLYQSKLGFQIDYPEMKFMNFIEHETLPSILIVGDFAFTLDMIPLNDTVKDAKQYAQTVINDSITLRGQKMLQNINPSHLLICPDIQRVPMLKHQTILHL
jgi:hypothetical protein